MKMSKGAEEAMNSITVHELCALNVSCGMIAVIGNGQLVKITTQDDVTAEEERCVNGY